MDQGAAPIHIRIDAEAGHGMRKPTAPLIAEQADDMAFVAMALDVEY